MGQKCTSDAATDEHWNQMLDQKPKKYDQSDLSGTCQSGFTGLKASGSRVSSSAANSSTRVCENVGMRIAIHRQGQEAVECPVLSQPIGRPPADFLCLASCTPAPCQQCWAEGHV